MQEVIGRIGTSISTKPRTASLEQCPLCGSLRSKTLFRIPDRLHGIPGDYTYHRCASCKTVFQNPRVIPDDLSLCYPGDYYTHVDPAEVNQKPSIAKEGVRRLGSFRETLRDAIVASVQGSHRLGLTAVLGRLLAKNSRLRERAFYDLAPDILLRRGPTPLRAIEIGCGAGATLITLQRVGWEVDGVEWDAKAGQVARENTNCPIWIGDFHKLDIPKGVFHLVLLHHVFEHFDDPIKSLSRIKDLLVPGGRAVLFYPNPESLGARLYGDKWFPWEVPRHLVLPPVGALKRAASRVGLTPIRVYTTARFAAAFIAHSRQYQEGCLPDLTSPDVKTSDRTKGLAERALVRTGFNLGEEIIAVLLRPC